jgi:hypothetical protein
MIPLFRRIFSRLEVTLWMLRATAAYEAGTRLHKEMKHSEDLLYSEVVLVRSMK